jgi:hypothetical protein
MLPRNHQRDPQEQRAVQESGQQQGAEQATSHSIEQHRVHSGQMDSREAGAVRVDGVFQVTSEQQQEMQQRVEVEHGEQQKRAAEWDRERQEGPQDSQRETNHSNTEQTERKQKDHEKARRQAWLDAIIEKRRDDREREGGREM